MADEIEDGTATEQPADDIKSLLSAALAESETDPAPGGDEGDSTSSGDAAGRTRGPDGKFAKTEDAAPADGEKPPAAGKTDDPAAATGDKPASETTPAAAEPPAHWSEADKALFKGIPPAAQTFLLDRHRAMEADYTRKTQAIAEFRKEYEPVDQLFQPHREKMMAAGWRPQKLIAGWAAVEQRFMNGDGINAIRDIAKSYKIDLNQLLAQPSPAGQPGSGQQNPPTIDPALAGVLSPLQQQIQRMDAWIQQQHQAEQRRIDTERQAQEERQRGEVQTKLSEINSFINKKNEKGENAHPFYAEVEEDMVLRAQALQADGKPVPSLKELYDYAVYANPTTREKLLTARQQTEAAASAERAKAKAAAAKKAGSSVTGAPGTGQTAQPKGDRSLRETLMEAADA